MRILLPALLLPLLLPSLCLAWGGEGHQIVALVAEEHLTPAAKTAAKDLLDGANISDAEVANWADEIVANAARQRHGTTWTSPSTTRRASTARETAATATTSSTPLIDR